MVKSLGFDGGAAFGRRNQPVRDSGRPEAQTQSHTFSIIFATLWKCCCSDASRVRHSPHPEGFFCLVLSGPKNGPTVSESPLS